MNLLKGLLLAVTITALCLSLAAQQPNHPTTVEIFNTAKASVVVITGAVAEGRAQGSGFIIAPNQIATNFHVIDGLADISVKFSDGTVHKVQSVVKASKEVDLAILNVTTGHRHPLILGDELGLQEGDNVLALGAPRGFELTLTSGIVSSFRTERNVLLVQATPPIAPGSSGGPLLDSDGRVVGVSAYGIIDSPGLYFFVAASELRRLLKSNSIADLAAADDELESVEKEIDAGHLDAVSRRIDDLFARDPNSPKGLAIRGILALHQEHLQEAVRLLAKAAGAQPGSPLIQSYYALALVRIGEFRRALDHASKAAAIKPAEIALHVSAMAAYMLADMEAAKKIAQQLLSSNEYDETALETLTGVSYWENPATPAWLAHARELKKINPEGSWSLILDWYNSHDVQKLEQAKSAGFPNELPYILRAQSYLESASGADVASATREINAGVAVMPEASRLLSLAIFIDLLRGDTQSAAGHLSTLQNSTADLVEAHNMACLYYLAVDKSNLAMQECKATLQARPNSTVARSNYAWAALGAEQFTLALQEFTRAKALTSSQQLTKLRTIDLTWGLLLANWRTGHESEARKLYGQLLARGDAYVQVAELKKLPLVWSESQLSAIQAANDKWRRK